MAAIASPRPRARRVRERTDASSPVDEVTYAIVPSPFGRILLAATAKALVAASFADAEGAREPEAGWREAASPEGLLAEAIRQVEAFCAGTRARFDLPRAAQGTAFQQAVWQALCDVGPGETISYGALAARAGRPLAARAVGQAMNRNPWPLVVPCHRVIGSGGQLTGFGGGLALKERLLAWEADVATATGGRRGE